MVQFAKIEKMRMYIARMVVCSMNIHATMLLLYSKDVQWMPLCVPTSGGRQWFGLVDIRFVDH
jgi:hypothetical protein